MKWALIALGVAAVGFGVYWFFFREKPGYSPLATNKPTASNSTSALDVFKLSTASKPLAVNPSSVGAPKLIYGGLGIHIGKQK